MSQNANYRTIPNKLRNREDFVGSTMKGVTVQHAFDVTLDGISYRMIPGTYVVWSYSTVIAFRTRTGIKIVSETKHSNTTTRQQNLCRAWL